MKKEYVSPQVDWFVLRNNDVVTESTSEGGETPIIPITPMSPSDSATAIFPDGTKYYG